MAVPAFRVFLSHSSKDKDFVKDLYRRLTRDGVSCFFDIVDRLGTGAASQLNALASAEKTFEPGHPTIANRQSNLAVVLRKLGQLEEARDLLQNALASHEKTFPPGHPSIAIDQSNLATVLHDLGQLEEARDLLQKAYQAYLSLFGPDHPTTQTIRRNLESLGE